MAAQSVTVISKPTPGKLDTITLDAVVSETHTMTNTITDHPVEEGPDVSDHSRPEPDLVQMDCIVSNTPISGSPRTVDSGGQRFTVNAAQDLNRGKNAYDRLVQLRNAGTLFTVVTTIKTYESMGFTSISIPRDAKNSGALRFTVQLKKVRIVRNKLTRSVVAKDPRAGGKIKTGSQTMSFTEEELYGPQSGLDKAYESTRDSLNNGALRGFMNAVGGGG